MQKNSTIKLMKHYATDGTIKARCSYSGGTDIHGRKMISIYGKNYSRDLHTVFGARAENNTDSMTDYFEDSVVRIYEGDPLWNEALARVYNPKACAEYGLAPIEVRA